MGRRLLNLPAPGGGGVGLPDVAPTGSWWGMPGVELIQSGQLTVSPGGIYYSPFVARSSITVTAARFTVDEAPGGAVNVRIGIYGADGFTPDANAPAWDSGVIAVASDFQGLKQVDDLSIDLPAGRYLATIAISASLSIANPQRVGTSFVGDDDQLKATWFNAFAFGALPTPGPPALDALTDVAVPFLMQWTDA